MTVPRVIADHGRTDPVAGCRLLYCPTTAYRRGFFLFAGVSEQRQIGICFSDAEGTRGGGPYFGDRDNDLTASIRGLQFLLTVLDHGHSFYQDLVVPSWYLGTGRSDLDSDWTAPLSGLIDEHEYEATMASEVADFDQVLASLLNDDVNVCLESVCDELQRGGLDWSPFLENTVSDALLLIRGGLQPAFQKAMLALQNRRGATESRGAELYISYVESMLRQVLNSLDKILRRALSHVPAKPLPLVAPNQREELKRKLGALWRRTTIARLTHLAMEEQEDRTIVDINRLIGTERIDATEALDNLRTTLTLDQPYADLKFQRYHRSLRTLGKALYSMRQKLLSCAVGTPTETQAVVSDLAGRIADLLTFLHMSVRQQMPGVYTLRLPPRRRR